MLKFSVYSYCFNIEKNNFDYNFFLDRALQIGDEVVISVNTSEDDSLKILQDLSRRDERLKIIPTAESVQNPLFHGKLSDIALQNTQYPLKIQLDMDEYIVPANKPAWIKFGEALWSDFRIKALMVPSMDLYGSVNHCKDIKAKWYLHKGGCYRGAVSFGKKADGYLDINKTSSDELVDSTGNLVPYSFIVDPRFPVEQKAAMLKSNQIPYVVHTGYVDFNTKILRGKNFWSDHWKRMSNDPNVKIPLNIEEFNEPVVEHGIKIL